MYYERNDTPALARTSNLNEELGQVNLYICFFTADPLCSFFLGRVYIFGQNWHAHAKFNAIQEVQYSRNCIRNYS